MSTMAFIDANGDLRYREAEGTGTALDPYRFKYSWPEHMDSDYDSIDVDKMTKGAVTTAHSAITDTATSAEIDCRGYNSLLVHFVSDANDKTWTISVLGAMSSGLTFVPLLDKATGLAVSEITTDISGFFVISNIPDYVKIVATEVDDGATVTVKVQPFNG